jgi:hypothetical protein
MILFQLAGAGATYPVAPIVRHDWSVHHR